MAYQALELQPGYLLGLWSHALALCGLGRNEEAIGALERALTMSRAPIFVGALGLACARAGRLDDATRLLHELEERSSRGEYIPAFALLSIHVGQGDLAAIGRTLSKALEEATPPFSLRVPAVRSWRRTVAILKSNGFSSTCTTGKAHHHSAVCDRKLSGAIAHTLAPNGLRGDQPTLPPRRLPGRLAPESRQFPRGAPLTTRSTRGTPGCPTP